MLIKYIWNIVLREFYFNCS